MAGSTVTSKAILRTVRDTLVIFARLHLTSQYRPAVTRLMAELAQTRPAPLTAVEWDDALAA